MVKQSQTTIIFENGIIKYVGDNIEKDLSNCIVIEAFDKSVYPGFIIPNSTLD